MPSTENRVSMTPTVAGLVPDAIAVIGPLKQRFPGLSGAANGTSQTGSPLAHWGLET